MPRPLRRFLPVASHVRALSLALAAVVLTGFLPGCGHPAVHPDFEVSVSGSGPPIIFIPGIATPGEVWRPTVDALGGQFQCHVLTLAGFGGLPATRTDPFLPRVRDEIITYIRKQRLDHPVIVGHSMGGLMALWIAETAPELPGRLVIVDALPDMAAVIYPDVPPKEVRQQIAVNVAVIQRSTTAEFTARQHQMMPSWVASPELASKLADEVGKSDPLTVGRALGEMMNADLYPDLTKIVCPTLVMVSVADKIAHSTLEQVTGSFRQQYQPLVGVRFAVYPLARHFIMLDDPQGFRKSLAGELAAGKK